MRERRWPALRWGGIVGGAAAVLAGAHEALTSGQLSLATTLLAGVAFFLVCLVLFFAAGGLAACETNSVGSGTLAGLFAGLIGGIASIFFAIVHTVLQRTTSVSPVQYTLELVAGASGIFLAVFIVFLIFGAGFGALGGVAGRPIPSTPPVSLAYPPVASPGLPSSSPIDSPFSAPTVAAPLDAVPLDDETMAAALGEGADLADESNAGTFAASGGHNAPVPEVETGL